MYTNIVIVIIDMKCQHIGQRVKGMQILNDKQTFLSFYQICDSMLVLSSMTKHLYQGTFFLAYSCMFHTLAP